MHVPEMTAREHIGRKQGHGLLQLFLATGNEEEAGGVLIYEVLLQLPTFFAESSPWTQSARHLGF